MRRITLTLVSTLAVLVLLFAYKTSRDVPVASAQLTAAAAPAGVVISGASTTTSTASGSADPPATTATGQSITVPSTIASTTIATAPTTTASASAARRPTTSTSAAPAATAPVTAAKASTAAATTSSSSAAPEVVNGGAADTRYGPVQVQITVTGGKITAVTAIEYPQEERRDAEINAQAIPELQAQALSAQSAQIDGVSGATFTTEGFEQSLQSAIDAAHLSS